MAEIDPARIAGIEERLDRIVHLLRAIATKDMSKKESVLLLATAGLAPKEIAGILDVTANYVSVMVYEAKQAAAKQAKAPKNPKARALPNGD